MSKKLGIKLGKFRLVEEVSSKMMGGNGVSGTIRTVPENYYVATIDKDGYIIFEDLEACTRDINREKVRRLWIKKRIPIINHYYIK